MNEQTNQVPEQSSKDALKGVEDVRDLFARAHDLVAQAQHPGHMGMKVAEVLAFLKFHYEDFKLRAEKMAAQILAETTGGLNKVDVQAAQAATEAVLAPQTAQEAPKA